MKYLSLFAGVGGFDLGAEAAGWETVAQVEWDPAAQSVLAHHWPDVPRYGDVRDYRGATHPDVDAVVGGFPCQDVSVAGLRAGVLADGTRSNLYLELIRIVKEIQHATDGLRPRWVVVENVLGLPLIDDQRVVLMGLDHMVGRSGRLFRAEPGAGGWRLVPIAVLDAAPDVWMIDGSRLVFLTESGVWTSDGRRAERALAFDFGGLTPTSIVRAADGALYVGMRHYVLRLAEHTSGWEDTWFSPVPCDLVFREYECECQPQ